MSRDSWDCGEFFTAGLLSLIHDLFMMVTIMIFMLALDWRLTLLTFLTAPPLLGAAMFFRVPARISANELPGA